MSEQDPWLAMKPALDYRPPEDMIVVQLRLTSEGLYFQPILDYEVRRPKDELERGHNHEG